MVFFECFPASVKYIKIISANDEKLYNLGSGQKLDNNPHNKGIFSKYCHTALNVSVVSFNKKK